MEELPQFLTDNSRPDVKSLALQTVLGLTGSKEGIESIRAVDFGANKSPNITLSLVKLLDDDQHVLAKDAALCLINISADAGTAKQILQSNQMTDLVKKLYEKISDENCKIAEAATMIFSNLTRDIMSCSQVWEKMQENSIHIERIVFILCQEGYNKHGQNLRYLAPILSNLSQLPEVRRNILDKEQCIIQRLLPFTEYADSSVKKGGVIGTLRNCCFDVDYHEFILGEDVDILPRLLLPLAGPTPESLEDEDIEKLPLELQYLDDDKKVEEDPDIRKMILEALTQLCAKKYGREVLREKNAYVILRELHKDEQDREVLLAAENVIDILIKTEQEINLENYKDTEVPADLIDKFKQMDAAYLKD